MEKVTVSHVGTDHINFYSGSDYIWYPINFDTPRIEILTKLKEEGYKVSLLGLDAVVCSDPSVDHIMRVRTPDHNPVLIAFHEDGKAGIIERPELHQKHHDTVQGLLFDMAQEALEKQEKEEAEKSREEDRLKEQERLFQRERERVEEIRRLQEIADKEKEEDEKLEAERKIQELKDQEAKEELERQERVRKEQEEAENRKKEEEAAALSTETEDDVNIQEETDTPEVEEEDAKVEEADSDVIEETDVAEEDDKTSEEEAEVVDADYDVTEETDVVEEDDKTSEEEAEVVEAVLEVPVAKLRKEPEHPEVDEDGVKWLASPEDESILSRLEEDDLVFERDGWSDPDWNEDDLESLDWDDIDEEPVAETKSNDPVPVIPEEKDDLKEYEQTSFEEPELPKDPIQSAVEDILNAEAGNIGRDEVFDKPQEKYDSIIEQGRVDSVKPMQSVNTGYDTVSNVETNIYESPSTGNNRREQPPKTETASMTDRAAYETPQMNEPAVVEKPAEEKPWEQFEEKASSWGGSATSKRNENVYEAGGEVHQPIKADLTTEEAAIRQDELEKSKRDQANMALKERYTHEQSKADEYAMDALPEIAAQSLDDEEENQSTFTSGWKLFDHHVQRGKPLKIKVKSKIIAERYHGFKLRKFNRSYIPIFFDELNAQGITHKKLMDQDKTEINQWVELRFPSGLSVHLMITYAARGKSNRDEDFYVYFPKKIAEKKTYHQSFLNALVIYKIWNHVLYKINWYTADHNYKPANREALVKYFLNLDKMQDLT